MKLPKTESECRGLLQQANHKLSELREKQIKIAKEYAQLIKVEENILTKDNFQLLVGIVSLAGKECIPILLAQVKDMPRKDVMEKAGKLGFYCTTYDLMMKWFFNQVREDQESPFWIK